MIKAVYIHIPFCKHICSYCSFCKFYYNEEMVTKYLIKLEEEIKEKYQNEVISTIYIGGGTPSDLSINNLEKLLNIIKIFKIEKDCELTFECNFDIDEERLLLLKKYGINRLSFGIETINEKYLKIIERTSNKENIIAKIKLCRKLGFNNINGDLMYAFEKETLEELEKDVKFLLSLNLEHISTYSLIIEEHTKLFLNNFKNCDEELDAKMYYFIHDILTKNNYKHYEVSNFAKNNFYSRHNMTYWKNKEYYGFGIGASGYIKNIRYNNTRSFNNYLEGKYKFSFEELNSFDIMSYEMILKLRTIEGVSFKEFFSKFHLNINEVFNYDDLIEKNLLKIDDDRLYIPYDKWYVMNSILERFVEVNDE